MREDERAKMERALHLEVLSSVLAWAWLATVAVALFCFIASLLSLVGEIIFWLRYGFWFGAQFHQLLYWVRSDPLIVNWVGFQKIILWMLDAPLWAGLAISGLIVASIAATFSALAGKLVVRSEAARREWEDILAKAKLK